MDKDDLIRQLRAWADGVDPATGETLPADHPAQRADLLRVLYGALALLDASPSMRRSASAKSSELRASMPRNAGQPWSAAEDRALAEAFDGGASIGAMATTFERTRGAINARLVRLGKIDPTAPMLRMAVAPPPAPTEIRTTSAEVKAAPPAS